MNPRTGSTSTIAATLRAGRAVRLAFLLGVTCALMLALGADSRKGHDEEVLLKSTKVSAEGNKVVFKLTMEHDAVVDIVKKGMALPTPTASPS